MGHYVILVARKVDQVPAILSSMTSLHILSVQGQLSVYIFIKHCMQDNHLLGYRKETGQRKFS